MAATIGNEFWKLRSKNGRDKIFSSPEELLAACYEYFKEINNTTIGEQNWVGKDGTEVIKNHPIPFTLTGLCTFLDITTQTWRNYRDDCEGNDLFGVVAHVDQIIYTQKFSYAAIGLFNQNIIARDLGLVDKKEHESPNGTMSPKPTIINVSGKEIDIAHLTDGKG